MSVEMPEPDDRDQTLPGADTGGDHSVRDDRFDNQEFSLNEVLNLARLGEGPHVDAFVDFVDGAHALHEHIGDCVQDGSIEDALKGIGESGQVYVDLFNDLRSLMGTLPAKLQEAGMADDDAVRELTLLLCSLDHERVNALIELQPSLKNQLMMMGRKDIEDMVRNIYEIDDSVDDGVDDLSQNRGEAMIYVFMRHLKADISVFSDSIIVEERQRKIVTAAEKILAQEPEVPRSRLERIGGHALDVAKIAAGVAAGIAISRLFKK